jgi:hypothetical protein
VEQRKGGTCVRTMNTLSGMVGASGWTDQISMPSIQKREAPPMTAVPGLNERL